MNNSHYYHILISNKKMIVIFVIFFISIFVIFDILSNTTETFIVTDSMFPTFEGYQTSQISGPFKGEFLIAYRQTPHVGDIIIFSTPENSFLTVHRIVFEKTVDNKTYYLTKGDNNPETDMGLSSTNLGWISQDQILGVVVFGIPNLGTFINLLQTYNFGIILPLVLIVALSYEGINYIYHKRKGIINHKPSPQSVTKLSPLNRKYLISLLLIGFIFFSLIPTLFFFYDSPNTTIQILDSSYNPFPKSINLANSSSSEAFTVNNITYSFYNFKISFLSDGFFNSVRELLVETNISSHFFKWTAVKDLAGINTINALLIIPLTFNGTITAKISINGYTASYLPFLSRNIQQFNYFVFITNLLVAS